MGEKPMKTVSAPPEQLKNEGFSLTAVIIAFVVGMLVVVPFLASGNFWTQHRDARLVRAWSRSMEVQSSQATVSPQDIEQKAQADDDTASTITPHSIQELDAEA